MNPGIGLQPRGKGGQHPREGRLPSGQGCRRCHCPFPGRRGLPVALQVYKSPASSTRAVEGISGRLEKRKHTSTYLDGGEASWCLSI